MGSGLGSSLAPLPTGMSLMQRPSSSSDHHLSPSGHLTPTGMHTHTHIRFIRQRITFIDLQIRPHPIQVKSLFCNTHNDTCPTSI